MMSRLWPPTSVVAPKKIKALLVLCAALQLGGIAFLSLRRRPAPRPPPLRRVPPQEHQQSPPDFLLGLSTGHAGPTTYHKVIKESTDHCPWKNVLGKFESTAPDERDEINEMHDPAAGPCNYTDRTLIPYLEQKRGDNTTYVDLGHFHNRLPHGLECLAERLGDRLAFVRIRRNRYAIARSFESKKPTPCFHDLQGKEGRHPSISYCPLSTEKHGPTYLPVEDQAWLSLHRFQKYLWLADEMELRAQHIKESYPRVRFYETTWTTGAEFEAGIDDVKRSLGCHLPSNKGRLPNLKKHIFRAGKHNCTEPILKDLEYRRRIGMTREQSKIIFSHPQGIGGPECIETTEDLKRILSPLGERVDDWTFIPGDPSPTTNATYPPLLSPINHPADDKEQSEVLLQLESNTN